MYSCKCCAYEFKFLYWKKVRPEKSSTFSLLELFSGRTFFLDSSEYAIKCNTKTLENIKLMTFLLMLEFLNPLYEIDMK